MSKSVYVCNYCGEILIAEGDKISPQTIQKCSKCGSNNFSWFIDANSFESMKNRNANIDHFIKVRFDQLAPQWGEHKKQGITPTSGETPLPHCPTCGSNNIRRISNFERGSNAAIWGLLGNKRKYQFECLNPSCGYKW